LNLSRRQQRFAERRVRARLRGETLTPLDGRCDFGSVTIARLRDLAS